ncbi:hypothetical protein H6G27_25735 [Nostoc linckia FACHB-104]|nr:hypothetical protein [Nostoc linckia FACHB-104]
MSKTSRFRLGAFIQATGHHISAWRHPDVQENYKEFLILDESPQVDKSFIRA